MRFGVRGRVLATALLATILAGAAPNASGADEEIWQKLANGTDGVTKFARESVDELLSHIDDSVAFSGQVFVFAAKEADRTALAARLDAAVGKARETLTAAGFALEDFDRLSVVWVRAMSGASGAAFSKSGNAIYFRENESAPSSAPPPLRRPADGPPKSADVVAASDTALAALDDWTSRNGLRAGPGSLSNAVARVLVAHMRIDPATPPWLREGLIAWLESAAFPDVEKVPLHVCGAAAPQVAAWLSPKARPTAAQARLLGRLVAALLEGATDGPARVQPFAAATGDKAAAALAEVLAPKLAAILAALPKPAGGARNKCDESGTVPCPLCKGGKMEVACGACFGLGGVACPSCGGDPRCPAPGCCDGVQLRKNADYDCKFCGGTGWSYCRTCDDKARFPCKVCGSSGKLTRPCLVCRGKGRVPCPEGGASPAVDDAEAACPWCGDKNFKVACAICYGSGVVGCRTCHGRGMVPCPACYGAGCDKCQEHGSAVCRDGDGTKRKCEACGGTGVTALDPKTCPACGGAAHAPDAGLARQRIAARPRGVDATLRTQIGAVVGKAVRFLQSSAVDGEFALRHQRWIPEGTIGNRRSPTFFSNALVLWGLFSAHVGKDQPDVAKALERLKEEVGTLLGGKGGPEYAGLQAPALALRALLAADIPVDDPLVAGLVKRLVAAQRPSGYWADELDSKETGDAFEALFAVESLWLAQRRGAKVPGETWSRAYAAGSKVSSAVPKSMRRNGYLTATDVASSAALLVMAKAGGLGEKAKNLDEYRSIPQVAQALAWLDRHFDLVHEPVVASGARVRGDADGGYAAWIYAVERLARLLSIDEIGGRRWYVDGCRHLATLQFEDGDFEELHMGRTNGPVRTTVSVLLFLSRATPPITGEASPDDAPEDHR